MNGWRRRKWKSKPFKRLVEVFFAGIKALDFELVFDALKSLNDETVAVDLCWWILRLPFRTVPVSSDIP